MYNFVRRKTPKHAFSVVRRGPIESSLGPFDSSPGPFESSGCEMNQTSVLFSD